MSIHTYIHAFMHACIPILGVWKEHIRFVFNESAGSRTARKRRLWDPCPMQMLAFSEVFCFFPSQEVKQAQASHLKRLGCAVCNCSGCLQYNMSGCSAAGTSGAWLAGRSVQPSHNLQSLQSWFAQSKHCNDSFDRSLLQDFMSHQCHDLFQRPVEHRRNELSLHLETCLAGNCEPLYCSWWANRPLGFSGKDQEWGGRAGRRVDVRWLGTVAWLCRLVGHLEQEKK